jgi:hypothetical protein
MFGFRTRFVPEKMTSYMGSGAPSNYADQSHKPIESYVKEKMQALLSKYDRLEDYNTKQTIVKVLDSDNEEDEIEIEKNKKMIKMNQRIGANFGNVNPKIRKKHITLRWSYNKKETSP